MPKKSSAEALTDRSVASYSGLKAIALVAPINPTGPLVSPSSRIASPTTGQISRPRLRRRRKARLLANGRFDQVGNVWLKITDDVRRRTRDDWRDDPDLTGKDIENSFFLEALRRKTRDGLECGFGSDGALGEVVGG